jgi:asparaginyl-tRNA synthetase
VYVHTPIITTSDCEGAGEMFTVTTLGGGVEQATERSRGRGDRKPPHQILDQSVSTIPPTSSANARPDRQRAA